MFWSVEEMLGELCEVSRCLLWRGLRYHHPIYNVSCIFFNKLLYVSYYMAAYYPQETSYICIEKKGGHLSSNDSSTQSLLYRTSPKDMPMGLLWVVLNTMIQQNIKNVQNVLQSTKNSQLYICWQKKNQACIYNISPMILGICD